jgi:hypothetical protein
LGRQARCSGIELSVLAPPQRCAPKFSSGLNRLVLALVTSLDGSVLSRLSLSVGTPRRVHDEPKSSPRVPPRPSHECVKGSLRPALSVARSLGCGAFGGMIRYARVLLEAKTRMNDARSRIVPRCPSCSLSCVGEEATGAGMRAATSIRNATWLILPVVICLSQRLSHACVSMN